MNKKAKELEIKINNAKIISDDINRGISTTNFFSNQQRKEENMQSFANEFQGKAKV